MAVELSGLRILVVEDEAMIAMLIEDQLDELGCIVATQAASVSEGLAAVAATPVDAAVLDVNLRGEFSYVIADALAARHVPYLFITGYGQCGLDPAYQDRPVLQKPFMTDRLGEALIGLMEAAT